MKRFPRSPRRSSVAACLAVGFLSAACVQPGPPTVGMSKVEASLVFGLTDVPQPVPSPIEQVVQIVRPSETVTTDDEPEAPEFQFAKPFVPRFTSGPTAPEVEECPEASISAAPKIAPQPRISGDVRPGMSEWRVQSVETLTAADGTKESRASIEIPVPRVVRNVTELSSSRYSFEEVATFGSSRLVRVTTYEVNTEAINRNPSHGVGIVVTPGVGEPERGITLVKEEYVDTTTGQAEWTFAPTTGLLVLPLPVVAGERFASTATDPRTGETRTHEALVLERQRVDACGELIDGWGVTYQRRHGVSALGTVVATASPDAVVEVTTVFATQYGGVPILENFSLKEGQCENCPIELKQRVGQVDPDPPTNP